MRYGIWMEIPGIWKGWFGAALGDEFRPMTFGETELAAAVSGSRAQHPNATLIEARPSPPESLPWNEGEWAKHKAVA